MRASAARTLPSATRLRELVTRVACGLAAEAIDARVRNLVALPHAARVPAGEAYLTWDPGIVVRPGETVTWSFTERGVTTSGTATVFGGVATGSYPDAPLPRAERRRTLVEDGKRARWEFLTELEPHVADALAAANRYIARGFERRLGDAPEGWAPEENHGAVDAAELEAIATEMLFGAEGADSSVLQRMLTTAATTPINNQPLGAWLAANIAPRAEEYIRRRIGDPHIGPKVRRIFDEHQPRSLEELRAIYRKAHPRDQAGKQRLLAALSAGKTIDATAASLTALSDVDDSEGRR